MDAKADADAESRQTKIAFAIFKHCKKYDE